MPVTREKLLLAGASLPVTEALMAGLHGGPVGGILALGLSGLVYVIADEIETRTGREISLPRPTRKERGPYEQGVMYKLTHGRSVRGDDAPRDESVSRSDPQEWDESWYGDEDDELAGPGLGDTAFFTLSDVLASGFVPSLSAIYLGRLADGTPITVAAKDLCHVALPGATGHGKTSLIRLIMAQLCYCGLPVYLLNPDYMVFDREHNEDWTPFTPYLKSDPMACKDMRNIKIVLEWMVNKLLPQRKARAAEGKRIGKPYFFIMDEVPIIVKEIPGASEMIGKILRDGRKYGIYLIVASQDFSVKTLGVEGEGSVRKCFLTVLYVGGDPISVKELLNVKANQIAAENELGKGSIMVRAATIKDPTSAQTPYTDNDALCSLLGPSTFVLEDDDSIPDDDEDFTQDEGAEENEPDKSEQLTADQQRALDLWKSGTEGARAIQRATGWTYYKAQTVCSFLVEKGLID